MSLAYLDCAACGCGLFQHVLRPDLLASEIPMLEDFWGDVPPCLTKHLAAKGKAPVPDTVKYCECPGYVPPLLFTYGQLLELLGLMGSRNPETAISALTGRERNHGRTGRPRGRPPKAARADQLVLS